MFCDPEIVTLPPTLAFIKKPVAWFIAKSRAAEVTIRLRASARQARSPLHKTCCRGGAFKPTL